jgi:hypothetical protein
MLTQLFKSKTVVFNVLTLAGAALGGIAAHEMIAAHPQAAAGIAAAISVINVMLRIMTTKPISQK